MTRPPRTGFSPPNRDGRPDYTIGEAIGWAWTVFARNAASLVAATVILGITRLDRLHRWRRLSGGRVAVDPAVAG